MSDFERLRERLAWLEGQMQRNGFWDNEERAVRLSREHTYVLGRLRHEFDWEPGVGKGEHGG